MRKILVGIVFIIFIAAAINHYINSNDERESLLNNVDRKPKPRAAPQAQTQKPADPAPTPNTAVKTAPQPLAQPQQVQMPVNPVAENKNTDPLKNYKSDVPPKVVPFEITSDGLAIAYGDIILGTPTQETKATHGVAAPPKLNLWQSSVIPYHIQPNLPNPERVLEALEHFNQSPITFVKYSGQPDAIVFEAREGHCKSYLGRVGGLQPIWLSDNCDGAEIVHEVMHALGFIHEQSRIDRSEYLDIVWENIEEQYKAQFTIVPEELMLTAKGTAFDFQSVMLYQPTAFAIKPGLTTMRAKNNSAITPAQGLSKSDLERLYKFYGGI